MALIDFENRLRKRFKHKAKWAKSKAIFCYRVYDKDLPDFPFVIDKFEEHVIAAIDVIEEGKESNKDWLLDIKRIISEVLNIDIENISIKLRSTQKGKNQYNKLDYSGALLSVQEFGLLFLINPFDYLDTGLFLDHRITRQWVKKDALNKRVLNLFAYTGSFSVYAAAGDAVKVTTVDMSNTYLQWAEKNMHLNGFKSSKKYDYIREDILDWIPTVPTSSYDLIILDPPTFSNSKKMLLTWDVQRDHVHLINQIRSILSPGGILYFSNNYKKFKLNFELIEGYESIEELTDKSIPEDFERSKPHVSFRLVNKMV
jgi:23S rRNA (cytosine1962-C5)-methyltransferase